MVLSDCKISILCKRKQSYTIKYNKKRDTHFANACLSACYKMSISEKYNENIPLYRLYLHYFLLELVVIHQRFVLDACLVGVDCVDRIVEELGYALAVVHAQTYEGENAHLGVQRRSFVSFNCKLCPSIVRRASCRLRICRRITYRV